MSVTPSDLSAPAPAPAPPAARRSTATTTATFVRAAGMADDTALAWLDAVLPRWESAWALRGPAVLAEVQACGHPRLVERLIELLGAPAP